jgi:alcohol dehydrogenase
MSNSTAVLDGQRTHSDKETMHALVYGGPDQKKWAEVPKPTIIDDTDAIIRVDITTICGSDLHILKGDVPEVTVGRILGHEAIGTVESVGPGVKIVKPGQRVVVSCISSCSICRFCREGRFGQCLNGGGWILGHLIDGTQAEFVRVPFCDTSTYPIPKGVSDEELLMFCDIIPTGYEVGVLNGAVAPGDVVAVVGAGPVGLAAIKTAKLFSPRAIVAIDLDDKRLDQARKFGADYTVNNGVNDPLKQIMALTSGLGADVAIEAVGLESTFELATTLVRACGHIANIGVHGAPAVLHLEKLWGKDVTITTGLVDTRTVRDLLGLVETKKLDVADFVTHRFKMAEIIDAYETFSSAGKSGALKVVLTP